MGKHHKQPSLTPERYIRTRARTLPVGVCYINDDWKYSGFAMILVTRVHINGNVTYGYYIIDLYCLGLKETFWNFNQHPLDFRKFLDKHKQSTDLGFHLIEVDYLVVHNIIYGAIAYAGEFGFHPHKSFELTKHILEEDTEHIKLIDIGFGYKGKPLYISSPENPGEKHRTLAQLEKNPGSNNYYFITEAEAEEFFEREDNDERDAIDYQDPEVKKELILNFIKQTVNPKKFLKKSSENLTAIIENADIIHFEYIITGEESRKASSEIKELFDIRISDELLSDLILFGNVPPPANSKEIRRKAEELYHMATHKHSQEGLKEAVKMIDQYPDVPVFQYLYLKFMEINVGIGKLFPVLQKLADKDPGYLPYAYMLESSYLINNLDNPPQRISEELHLKRFHPEVNSFCREEVLLYIHLLIMNYSLSGETVMIEELLSYMFCQYPDLISNEQIFAAKISKIPYILEWCEKWIEENMGEI